MNTSVNGTSGPVEAVAPPLPPNATWDELGARVGRTPLRPAPKLGRRLGVPNLFLKYEGTNPTGTQKDRIAWAEVEEAKRRGLSTIVVATCGNYGAAAARFAKAAGIACVVYVPDKFSGRRLGEIEAAGARVVRTDGEYEEAVAESSEAARSNGWLDANPGPASFEVCARAYAPLATEIVEGLGRAPEVVSVPTSNGSTLAGVWKGFVELRAAPKMIAASTKMGNPIVWSLAYRHEHCQDLQPNEVLPSETSEPLSNYHSFDGDAALAAVRASQGWGFAASDAELEKMAVLVRKVAGLPVQPAATAGIAALRFAGTLDRLGADDTHVAILSGRP